MVKTARIAVAPLMAAMSTATLSGRKTPMPVSSSRASEPSDIVASSATILAAGAAVRSYEPQIDAGSLAGDVRSVSSQAAPVAVSHCRKGTSAGSKVTKWTLDTESDLICGGLAALDVPNELS